MALGLDDLTAFPLFPTISATVIPLDHNKQLRLHQQETMGLLVKLYLNLEAYVFPVKMDLGMNKKLPSTILL